MLSIIKNDCGELFIKTHFQRDFYTFYREDKSFPKLASIAISFENGLANIRFWELPDLSETDIFSDVAINKIINESHEIEFEQFFEKFNSVSYDLLSIEIFLLKEYLDYYNREDVDYYDKIIKFFKIYEKF